MRGQCGYRFAGYTAHHRPISEAGVGRGSLILVKDTIPHRIIDRPVHCGEGVETQAVKLLLNGTEVHVYSVYRQHRSELDLTELLTMASETSLIVAGDFNAHHETLGSRSPANEAGRHLTSLLDELEGIRLLNTGEPTHMLGNPLDLTLVSAPLAEEAAWSVHPTLTSDHFATVTKLAIPLPRLPPVPARWSFKRANWVTFRREVASWWEGYTPPEDVEDFDRDFTAALDRAATVAIPRVVRGRPPPKGWWFYGPRMREVNHRVNYLRRTFRRNRTDRNLQLLREAVLHQRQVAAEEREAKWLEWCEDFSRTTPLGELWAKLRKATGGKPRRPPVHPNAEGEAERLVRSYAERATTRQLPEDVQRRQNQLLPSRLLHIQRAKAREDVTDCPFTLTELRKAKNKGRDTAPGEDGTTYTMLRSAGRAGEDALLALVNASWMVGRLPARWKEALIHPIPKPREPEKTRPISLLSCTAKTAERMVLNRLKWKVGEPHHNIYGFTNGRSTADSIASLLASINDRPAIVIFLDLEKAFELASPTAIAHALASKGVSGRLLQWTHDYLCDRSAKVRYQGHTSMSHVFENGTPQGGVLSPTLFNVLMGVLVELPLHRQVTLLSYADDLALVCAGRGNRVARAQVALDAVTEACKELGLKVSAEKSRAMAVMAPTPEEALRIQGVRLQWTAAYQYLGVWIDQRLTFRKEVNYLKERTKLRLTVMRAMTSSRAGATQRVLRLYYLQAVRSLVDYAAVALVTLSDGALRALEAVQNTALRSVLGAPRWTKLEALRAEASLPPLALRVDQLVAAWVAKLVTRPSHNPARQCLVATLPQDNRLFVQKTWLQAVANAAHRSLPGVNLVERGEDRKADGYVEPPPWAETTTRVHISSLPYSKSLYSREFLLARAQETLAQTGAAEARVYYTDGSVDQDNSRTAAAIVCGEEKLAWRTSDTCSTLQTELVAITSALLHAEHSPDRDIAIYTDSMAALQVLTQDSPKDNVSLVTMARVVLSRLESEGRRVTLAWIPSHVGVPGNEAADSEAKRGLQQHEVRINVPLSLQRIKRIAKATTMRRARALLADAEATSATLQWYRRATEHEVLQLPTSMPRSDMVRIHRLRLGYPTVRSLAEGYQGEICRFCETLAEDPLVHFLLDCEETGRLRTLAAARGFTDCGVRVEAAASMVRYLTDDYVALTAILRQLDPPR